MSGEGVKRLEVLAIIPARGGSKGIPRKNIRELAGKPLIAYTIEAALSSRVIDKVVVSTEDREIAALVREYGIEVINRPQELATDTAATEPVLEHAIQFLEKQENYRPDIIVLLQATSPLRQSRHIQEAMGEFLNSNCDSLLSVCLSHMFIWRIRENGAKPLNYDYRQRPRKQDMPQEIDSEFDFWLCQQAILKKRA